MTTATLAAVEATTPCVVIAIDAPKAVDRLRDLNIGKRSEVYAMDPRLIVVEPGFNPRDFNLPANREHINTLKASILALNGVQQALWVRWDSTGKIPILLDGECRLKAVLELIEEGNPLLAVPVTQKTHGVSSVADRLALALTANEGLRLSQIEVGATYLRLIGFKWTEKQIAEKVGKSERYVRDAIAPGRCS